MTPLMTTDNLKVSPNSVALAGEFAVLSQLALRGYDANMTLGRTKNVDILVSNPKGMMYKLEVKSNLRDIREEPSNSKIFGKYISDWIMHKKQEEIIDDNLFYCFVNIGNPGNKFRFFIVHSEVVARYIKEQHQYWLKQTPQGKDGPMRLFRIGLRSEKYVIPTPAMEDYENNWSFKLFKSHK